MNARRAFNDTVQAAAPDAGPWLRRLFAVVFLAALVGTAVLCVPSWLWRTMRRRSPQDSENIDAT